MKSYTLQMNLKEKRVVRSLLSSRIDSLYKEADKLRYDGDVSRAKLVEKLAEQSQELLNKVDMLV